MTWTKLKFRTNLKVVNHFFPLFFFPSIFRHLIEVMLGSHHGELFAILIVLPDKFGISNTWISGVAFPALWVFSIFFFFFCYLISSFCLYPVCFLGFLIILYLWMHVFLSCTSGRLRHISSQFCICWCWTFCSDSSWIVGFSLFLAGLQLNLHFLELNSNL